MTNIKIGDGVIFRQQLQVGEALFIAQKVVLLSCRSVVKKRSRGRTILY